MYYNIHSDSSDYSESDDNNDGDGTNDAMLEMSPKENCDAKYLSIFKTTVTILMNRL